MATSEVNIMEALLYTIAGTILLLFTFGLGFWFAGQSVKLKVKTMMIAAYGRGWDDALKAVKDSLNENRET